MSKTAEQSFLALLDEHKAILFKIASSYCPSAAEREDLVQEMILQLWRSYSRFDPLQRFSTWMYRVALNVAISFYRNQRRRPRTRPLDEGAVLELSVSSTTESPTDELRLLDEFMQRLSELDRALLLLYLDDNSYEMIGDILGISASNVGTKLGRIKLRLRQMGANHTAKE